MGAIRRNGVHHARECGTGRHLHDFPRRLTL
jgi:hypothetical protein